MLYSELAKRNKLHGRGSRLCYVFEKDSLSRLVLRGPNPRKITSYLDSYTLTPPPPRVKFDPPPPPPPPPPRKMLDPLWSLGKL